MPTRYTLTVFACALSWFMLGLHVPMIHDLTHSGRAPEPLGFVLVLLFGALSIRGLWALLRFPGPFDAVPEARRCS